MASTTTPVRIDDLLAERGDDPAKLLEAIGDVPSDIDALIELCCRMGTLSRHSDRGYAPLLPELMVRLGRLMVESMGRDRATSRLEAAACAGATRAQGCAHHLRRTLLDFVPNPDRDGDIEQRNVDVLSRWGDSMAVWATNAVFAGVD